MGGRPASPALASRPRLAVLAGVGGWLGGVGGFSLSVEWRRSLFFSAGPTWPLCGDNITRRVGRCDDDGGGASRSG
jgi:hypothetical protein